MVEKSGIPVKKDKNVYNVNKIADLAGIELFTVDQIGIAHRTWANHFASIIILFSRKQDWITFYSQKRKLRKLKVLRDSEKAERDSSGKNPKFIFMNERLTSKNSLLLKEQKKSKEE